MRPDKNAVIFYTDGQLHEWDVLAARWVIELHEEDARPTMPSDPAFERFMARVLA